MRTGRWANVGSWKNAVGEVVLIVVGILIASGGVRLADWSSGPTE